MPALSKYLLASVAVSQCSALVLPTVGVTTPVSRTLPVRMQDPGATRDSAPQVSFDNNMDGWKPPGGGGGDAHGGSGFTSTDTPDFAPEDEKLAALAAGVSFTDGMQGSQVDPNRKKSTGPELEGALDSDPDIYIPDEEVITKDDSLFVLPAPEFRLSKMAVSSTHEDFEMFCDRSESKTLKIDVKPVCMTFEAFTCGFTADSHPAFSVYPDVGKMERRNGAPTQIQVTVKPNGASGTLVGHLCFILPDEKDFSTFYEIKCESR